MLSSDAELTALCVKYLQGLDLDDLGVKVSVVWNDRMRTAAGRAFWPEAKIEMNPKLRAFDAASDVAEGAHVKRTLLHELAHLVAYARCRGRRIAPHGVEWRQACVDLGIGGESVTHSLPLPAGRMVRRWRYTCPSCGEGFDRVRKMKRYAGCYRCCKLHHGGYYHDKFRLVESRIATV